MISEEQKSMLLAYLMGELDKNQQEEIAQQIKSNNALSNEYEALISIWETTDNWKDEIPSEEMDNRFFAMLDNAVEQHKPKTSFIYQIESFLNTLFTKQLMYRLAFMVVGVGIGFWFTTNNAQSQSSELTTVRQDLVLTLLEQPAANKRLQAVSEVSRFKEVDEKLAKALLKTLNNDMNDNVRIAAVESLVQFADNPLVREGLIASIAHQTSPLVQISLANTMVLLQEKNAKGPLQQLLEKEETNEAVKDRIEKSIKQII
ncbi:HEAT repeat domain-containing protein [Spongiivirga sp. MCCC 1A20706]|uniref:HEAT repeat domain-containing protein n=1 Tax=Spongiivirga sp. MCCC 1A20706 TaxID=3160963 RepID=UPI003977973E